MATISSLGIGSGLDLSGLLDQLESAEKEKLTPLVTQQKSYQTKLTAFGRLESSLGALQDSLDTLNDADTFTAVKGSITGDAVKISTSGDAVAGRYQVNVTQLAQAQSLASGGHASRSEGLVASNDEPLAGKLDFTVGEGEDAAFSIDVNAGDSLEDLRDAINGANKGVSASIVNDGSDTPYRLVLTSRETGEGHQITITSDSDALANAFGYDGTGSGDMEQKVPARNAELQINGIDIVSQSNTVEGALEGVTLDLVTTTTGATTGAATLNVTKDTESMTNAVKAFVTAYNNFQSLSDGLTSYNAESDTAGALLGNSTMRTIESRLRGGVGFAAASGEMSRLSDLGVERQLDGTLKVDDDKLNAAITGNGQAVSQFFAGSEGVQGFADSLTTTLSSILDDGGTLDTATSGIDTSLTRLDDRYTRTQESITATVDRYRTQFAQLDQMVSQMNSTSSYLSQQFDALSAQLNQ